jgi:hypothetical protein
VIFQMGLAEENFVSLLAVLARNELRDGIQSAVVGSREFRGCSSPWYSWFLI